MKQLIISTLLFLLFSSSVFGQSLDNYLMTAAENNPNLKATFLKYQAALERIPQVGALPDPQLSFSIFIQPMERFAGNQVGSISIMQMFPWIGTLKAAKEEMSLMAKAEFEAFNETKAMLFYDVKITWYAILQLNKEIEITSENIQLLKSLENIALAGFKSGRQRASVSGGPGISQVRSSSGNSQQSSGMAGMNLQSQTSSNNASKEPDMNNMVKMENMSGSGNMTDVLRAQLELNELQNRLSILKERRIPLLARFNQLLNRDLAEPIILPDSLVGLDIPIPFSQFPDSIINSNPMLKMLHYEEASYIARGKMNKKMGMPMIGIGLQYDIFQPGKNSPAMMNGSNMLMPMATVSIPVWRKKYTAAVRESEIMREYVSQQIESQNDKLIVSYEEAANQFRDAELRKKLYREQETIANQALNLLLVQYSTEGSNFEEVLRMQQQLLGYRLQLLNAYIDGNISVATLERLIGR